MGKSIPSWLEDMLPEPRKISVMFYRDGRYIIEEQGFDTVDAAYEWASDNANFVIDDTVISSNKRIERFISQSSIGISQDDGNMRLLMFSTDQERLNRLREGYERFLKNLSAYEKNPHDFMSSYEFVDTHPLFWVLRGNNNLDWSTGGMAQCGTMNPVGNGEWLIEIGGHDEEYREHVIEPRLCSAAKNLNDAYIDLAAKLHMFYDDEGNEIPNVEYTKSDLELWYDSLLDI